DSTTNGTATTSTPYVYNPTPTINSVSPSFGPVFGGNQVHISGMNFGGILTVKFGTLPATIVSQTITDIVVQAPQSPTTGIRNVIVTSSSNGTPLTPGTYTYIPNPPPTISSITPA